MKRRENEVLQNEVTMYGNEGEDANKAFSRHKGQDRGNTNTDASINVAPDTSYIWESQPQRAGEKR